MSSRKKDAIVTIGTTLLGPALDGITVSDLLLKSDLLMRADKLMRHRKRMEELSDEPRGSAAKRAAARWAAYAAAAGEGRLRTEAMELHLRAEAQQLQKLRAESPLVPSSPWWVRGLLPGDEGTAWWYEVRSCLAETLDPGERRRYVRSYLRNAPQLIWVSWVEHLRASRRQEPS